MDAFVVVGLGFGDEGKGGIVDKLAREVGATDVVRFNGGAQAGHNVVLPDGRWHTFSQFGAASFIPHVRTHLSEHMIVNPLTLLNEAVHLDELGVKWRERLSIDSAALLTTPWQMGVNRLRELARGGAAHGTCGLGIGETVEDEQNGYYVTAGNIFRRDLPALLDHLARHKREEALRLIEEGGLAARAARVAEATRLLDAGVYETAEVFECLRPYVTRDWLPGGTVIFEGAQGVLLDQDYGFHPHTTWSDCTPRNALELAHAWESERVTTIGVCRSYMTRHGAGPLPTHLPQASFDEPHNDAAGWQGDFRTGPLDLVLLRYAREVVAARATLRGGDLDWLAVTHLDVPRAAWPVCSGYRGTLSKSTQAWARIGVSAGPDLARQAHLALRLAEAEPIYDDCAPEDVASLLGEALGVPVGIESHGPTHADKIVDIPTKEFA